MYIVYFYLSHKSQQTTHVKQVMTLLRVSWLKTSHGPLSRHFLSGLCSSYILCFFLFLSVVSHLHCRALSGIVSLCYMYFNWNMLILQKKMRRGKQKAETTI